MALNLLWWRENSNKSDAHWEFLKICLYSRNNIWYQKGVLSRRNQSNQATKLKRKRTEGRQARDVWSNLSQNYNFNQQSLQLEFFFDHFVFVARRSAAAMLLLLLGTPWGFHKDGKRFSVWLCVMEDLSSFWKQVLQLLPFYCLTLPPLSSAAVHQWSLLYGKQMANSSVFDWGVMTDMLGSCSFTA